MDRLFDERGLQLKDVVADAWEDTNAPPTKRIRPHVKAAQIKYAVTAHGWRFSRLVAKAMWLAEEHRCIAGGVGFDVQNASAGYTKDPRLWDVARWQSQAEVTAVWLWRSDGELCHAKLTSRLDYWAQRRAIPIPPLLQPLRESDSVVLAALVNAAQQAAEAGYLPCTYLGLCVDGGFEPDPAKWTPASLGGRPKAHATVLYEWEHVRCDSKPYRVPISVFRIVRQKRAVPKHPLGSDVYRGLCFTMKFMDEFAERRWPGTKYRGVVYENDERPEIYEQVPNDGKDIQDHRLYWSLPCGRCVCMSLRELYLAKPDQLHAHNSSEAYREIASELCFDVLGVAPDEQLEALREDAGALSDGRWRSVEWKMPEDESTPCWYLAGRGRERGTDVQRRNVAGSRGGCPGIDAMT